MMTRITTETIEMIIGIDAIGMETDMVIIEVPIEEFVEIIVTAATTIIMMIPLMHHDLVDYDQAKMIIVSAMIRLATAMMTVIEG